MTTRRWVHIHNGHLCFAWQEFNEKLGMYKMAQHRSMTLSERFMWRLARRMPKVRS